MRVVLLDGKDGSEIAHSRGSTGDSRSEASHLDGATLAISDSDLEATKASIFSLANTELRRQLTEMGLH